MTREQLDALENLHAKVPTIKAMPCDVIEPYTFRFLLDAHFNFRELIAQAREALELREALEWLFSQQNLHLEIARGSFHVMRSESPAYYVRKKVGNGSTPLEAINNAQRGK